MACGLPVITSNATAIPEVVGDSAISKEVGDEDGMARSCIEVLTNEKQQRELHEKGLKRARKFTWDRAAKIVVGVYEKVAKQKAG
jgi:glycosyltransferase involved in cell wall biosynthesis